MEKGQTMSLEKGQEIDLEKGQTMSLEKGRTMGLEKGQIMSLEKGQEIGLEKGQTMSLEEGQTMSLDKGQEIDLEKGQTMSSEKGRTMGLEKGQEMDSEKGQTMCLETRKQILRKKSRQEAQKRYASASITVEAVFVIPLLMLLFLALLWLALHLHDRSVIEGALFQTMEEGGEYLLYGLRPGGGFMSEDGGSRGSLYYAIAHASEKEIERWENHFYRELNKKLFLYQPTEVSCEKTAKETRVYVKVCCREFFPASRWGLSGLFCMEYSGDRLCAVREEVTRAGSVLLDLYEEKITSN